MRAKEKAWFKKQGIKLHCLFTKEELLKFLVAKKLVPKNTLIINQRYAADPLGWRKNKKYFQDFLAWEKECQKLNLW